MNTNEGKGKAKKKERGGRMEEKRKKSNGCTLSFSKWLSFGVFGQTKTCWTEKVHLAVTCTKHLGK